jgi:hypothetical protein
MNTKFAYYLAGNDISYDYVIIAENPEVCKELFMEKLSDRWKKNKEWAKKVMEDEFRMIDCFKVDIKEENRVITKDYTYSWEIPFNL